MLIKIENNKNNNFNSNTKLTGEKLCLSLIRKKVNLTFE